MSDQLPPIESSDTQYQKTNGFAVGSLVTSLLGLSVIAVILGHVGRGQIKRSRGAESGGGLALAGLVIGYVQIAILVLIIGGVAIYINFIKDDTPDTLSLDDTTTTSIVAAADDVTTPAAGDGLDGTWTATPDSVVGYRAKEVLFGQSTEGVGRTSEVTGELTIAGTSVETATFEVDMTSLESDQDNRDNQFNGRIMETDKYPTATFELTEPIDLGTVPADGQEITAKAKGKLTLKDQTKDVELDITAKKDGETFSVLTSYQVVFADWGINDPSFGPAQVEDNALLEVKLVFEKA